MCDFKQGFPFSLQLPYGTVTAALNTLYNKNCISLLTQCSDPMQTLAARRGTVGSAGRSLAHSLSTDTAYADCREEGEREQEGEKKKGWLDNAVKSPSKVFQWNIQNSDMKLQKKNHVSNKLATLLPPPHTQTHMCTQTHASHVQKKYAKEPSLAVHFTRNSLLQLSTRWLF